MDAKGTRYRYYVGDLKHQVVQYFADRNHFIVCEVSDSELDDLLNDPDNAVPDQLMVFHDVVPMAAYAPFP